MTTESLDRNVQSKERPKSLALNFPYLGGLVVIQHTRRWLQHRFPIHGIEHGHGKPLLHGIRHHMWTGLQEIPLNIVSMHSAELITN